MTVATIAPPLWAHQQQALDRLLPMTSALLGAGMASGKSRVALEMARERRVKRLLVICKKAAVENVWGPQCDRWLPDRRVLLIGEGSGMARERKIRAFRDGVITINYDALGLGNTVRRKPGDPKPKEKVKKQTIIEGGVPAALRDWLLEGPEARGATMVVFDEIQRLAAPGGQQSWLAYLIGQHATYRLGMSGTPLGQRPLGAYAVLRALGVSKRLGTAYLSFTMFKRHFTRLAYWGEVHDGVSNDGGSLHPYIYINQDELHDAIASISYFCNTRDYLDLPPEMDTVRTVTLEPEAQALYRKMERDFMVQLANGRVTASNAGVKIGRLLEMAAGSVHDEDGKIQIVSLAPQRELAEYFSELPDDEPVVVFGHYTADLAMIQAAGVDVGRKVLELSGQKKELARWIAGEAPILAVQDQVGGDSINLTRACYACFFSLGWSVTNYDQMRWRLVRPEQTRPVNFTHIVAKGTVAEEVMPALVQRADVLESVLRTRGGK